jgi:hypothetical protein
MTVPRGVQAATRRVSDMVRDILPFMRNRLSADEQRLGVHLRGNTAMYEALTGIIQSRVTGRAKLPEPSDPLMCKSMLARDRELQWLLSRLEQVYHSPASQPGDTEGEPPA